MSTTPRHDVVIVGGGNAGISLAARLRRDGCPDIALVEPESVHHYRPLLSYVAGGMATLDDLRRPESSVVPDGTRWYRDAAVAVDPERSVVRLAGGQELAYGDLVLCPGSQVDWDALPGSREAVEGEHAATSYLPEPAARTWRLLSSLTGGRAVFAVSGRHVPCSPVALKPMFLAVDHWRRTGVLGDIEVEVVTEGSRLVGEARSDHELRAAAEDVGVRVRLDTRLDAVDAAGRVLHVTGPGGAEGLPYDALYVAPPHRAPQWVADSGLATPESDGLVAVDTATLQHVTHPRIWGLGDVAAVDAMPSGGALRQQVPVVAENIAARRRNRPMRRYDGYSVAPVTTSRRRLLLAEFDRAGRNEPSYPFPDLRVPRLSTLLFDRHLQPPVYWHRLLRGKVS